MACQKVIQTDNEACFTSLFFGWDFVWHRSNTKPATWPHHGKTVVSNDFLARSSTHARQVRLQHADIDMNLQLFRLFYNSVRPHSNLDGKTSAEAWTQKNHNAKGRGYFVSEWDGVLEGIYLPP